MPRGHAGYLTCSTEHGHSPEWRPRIGLGQLHRAGHFGGDGGREGSARRGAIAHAHDGPIGQGPIGQGQRFAVYDIAINGELHTRGGNRALAIVDADRARRANEDREGPVIIRGVDQPIGISPIVIAAARPTR